MKLPSIDYNKPVQTLGRRNISQPITVANAEAEALSRLGGVASDIGMIAKGVSEDEGTLRFADAAREVEEAYADHKTRPPTPTSVAEFEGTVSEIEDRYDDKEMDFYARRSFQSHFRDFKTRRQANFSIEHIYATNRQQRDTTKAKVSSVAGAGDLDTALSIIGDSKMFSDNERAEMSAEVQVHWEVEQAQRIIVGGDPNELFELRKGYEPDNYKGYLNEDKRQSVHLWLDRAYKTADATELSNVERDRQLIASELEMATFNGQPEGNPVAIEVAFQRDLINGTKRTQLLKLWDSGSAETENEAQLRNVVSHAMNNNIPLDPSNPLHKRAVDLVYAEAIGDYDLRLPNTPLAQRPALRQRAAQIGANLAVKTNILPSQLKGEFRAYAMAGQPADVEVYANTFQALQTHSPQVLHNIPTEQAAIYTTVASLTRAGMGTTEAVELARENIRLAPEQATARRTEFNSLPESSATRLYDRIDDSEMDPWFGGPPDISPAMSTSYEALEGVYFTQMGGDIELASQAAYNHLLRIYRPTEVNGNYEMMPYSPEAFSGLTSDQLHSQKVSIAKKHNVSVDDVMVVSDGATAQEAAPKSYPLYKTDEFGLPRILTDKDGYPVRFTPSVAVERQKEKDAFNLRQAKAKPEPNPLLKGTISRTEPTTDNIPLAGRAGERQTPDGKVQEMK